MKLIDPTAAPPERALRRAPPLASVEGLAIGLLSNRKANAGLMLRETAAIFEARHGCTVTSFVEKANASAPAPPEKLAEVFAHADFMITGLGD